MLKGLRSRLCRKKGRKSCTAARCACGATDPVDMLAGLTRTMISFLMLMKMMMRMEMLLSMQQQRIDKKRRETWWSRDELGKKRKEKEKERKKRPSWSVRGMGIGGRRARADDGEGRCWYVKELLKLKVLL